MTKEKNVAHFSIRAVSGKKVSDINEAFYVCGVFYDVGEAYTARTGKMPGEEDEQQGRGSISIRDAGFRDRKLFGKDNRLYRLP